MHLDIVKAAAEITKEAVSQTPTNTMGIGPLQRADEVTAFLDKVAHKLQDLYREEPKPSH